MKTGKLTLSNVIIVVLLIGMTLSLLLALRNAKPVCERVVKDVCQYDLGEHWSKSDYIKVNN